MKTLWKNHDTWICTKHVPAAKMPFPAKNCWYCKASRPTQKRPAPVKKVVVEEVKISPPRLAWNGWVRCCVCQKSVKRRPSAIRANKSGKFYCSSEHQKDARRVAPELAELQDTVRYRADSRDAKSSTRVTKVLKIPEYRINFAECAWRECKVSSREKSKYCSRVCCVKNAHYNEVQRKRVGYADQRTA